MSMLIALAAIAATQPVADAQPAASTAPSEENTIVVRGSQDISRGELRQQAKAMSDPHQGHLPRYEDKVCMGMTGLSGPRLKAIVARFRHTAGKLGVELQPPGCKVNLMVMASFEPKELLQHIRHHKPVYMQTMKGIDRRRLFQSDGPAWVWRNVIAQRDDGGAAQGMNEVKFQNSGDMIASYGVPSRGSTFLQNVQQGRMRTPVRYHMDQTFIVLDTARLDGLDSHQIGDFLVIAGLSSVNLRRMDRVPDVSILQLFESDDPPTEASEVDLAYIRALYKGENGLNARQKLAEMSGRMKKILEEPRS